MAKGTTSSKATRYFGDRLQALADELNVVTPGHPLIAEARELDITASEDVLRRKCEQLTTALPHPVGQARRFS